MRNRKVLSLLLAIVILVAGNTTVAALETVEIAPMWENAFEAKSILNFNGNLASCTAYVAGYSGTTRIDITMTLELLIPGGGTSVEKTWSSTTYGTTATLSQSYAVYKGYTYRLTVSAAVTRNGVTEIVAAAMEKLCS